MWVIYIDRMTPSDRSIINENNVYQKIWRNDDGIFIEHFRSFDSSWASVDICNKVTYKR